ncbi:MAG: phosphatase PAP2 family protein [Oscillospiraceae bacterium]|nr:phosphatase PAP2 family protein [Oscillospiraceae bacterium]
MIKLPTRRQWIMMLYLPIHLLWYFILERSVTTDYYPISCALDGLIPFCEWFIFPYFLWFPYMVAAGFYFLFRDDEAFEQYLLSLFLGFFICTFTCSVFPNGQDLRQAGHDTNLAAQIVNWTQAFDTNTNVFPSMHVVGAVCAAYAITRSRRLRPKRWLQILNWALCLTIVCATVFIKQHSVLDIFAGVAVSVIAIVLVNKGLMSRLLTGLESRIDRKKRR